MTTDINQQKSEDKAQMLECALPAGTVLRGKSGREYKITEVLGAGGFGITYKAVGKVVINKETNYSQMATFAIKEFFMRGCSRDASGTDVLCSSSLRSDMEAGKRDFRKEAEVLVNLNGKSPHIVMVNEQFEAYGTWYYVMDYLDGKSLQQYIDALPEHSLPEKQALAWLLPIARAVALLHSHHLLHLDIKPENIMLKHDPLDGTITPVLIDFGLAKHFNKKGKPTSRLMARGATEGYAPLEQFGNITSFSPAMDVYALGATLYFMLTGKTPPGAYEVFTMSVSTFLQKNLPANVSPQMREVIERSMQPSVNARMRTVDEFVEALENKKSISPLPVGYMLHGNYASLVITEVVRSTPVCFIYKARLVENSWSAVVPPYIKQAGTAYYIYEWFILEDGVQLERDCYNTFYRIDTLDIECLKKSYTEEMLSICTDERLDDGSLRERAFRDDYIHCMCWSYFHKNVVNMFTPDCKPFDEHDNCLCDDFMTNNTHYRICPIEPLSDNGRNIPGTDMSDSTTVAFGLNKKRFHFRKKHVIIGITILLVCVLALCGIFLYKEINTPEWKAEHGDMEAQYYLGHCYMDGEGVIQNNFLAAYWYEKAAEQGHVEAQYILATFYAEGTGVPKSPETAVHWYEKAAEQGHMEAQRNLAICYEQGTGVAYDSDMALFWYKKAAEQGDCKSQLQLCSYYSEGDNKEYGDNKKAMYWYEKAAEQGSASAQYELGNFYYRGAGVSQSYEKAMYWYEKAAEKNNAEAQYMLGAFYAMGIGVPQNDETAEMWLKKAKENGYYGRCTLQAVKAAFYKPKSRAETERVLKDYYSNE